ncbi:MAG: hypothetical protein JRN67_03150 [Nitrososphaerota archaeon]|jgi:hypothetical protein|nr:hypothetical protein [Nitrososphaerota archaeon]
MILGILLSVGLTYFMTAQQDYKNLQSSSLQNMQENFDVNLAVASNGDLNVSITNTGGVTVTIQSITIVNTTSGATTCKIGTTVLSSTVCLIAALPSSLDTSSPALPVSANVGQNTTKIDTGVKAGSNHFIVKVTSQRGTTQTTTYPVSTPDYVIAAYQAVAAGLGSLEMVFNSFYWYPYISGPSSGTCSNGDGGIQSCSGGAWKFDINHPNWGSVSVYNNPILFSVQILNNDPNAATVELNAHTNLWVYQSCSSGCGSQPLPAFYIMNTNSSGYITSTTTGSFKQIVVPFNQSVTIYFGSLNDLTTGNYAATTSKTTGLPSTGVYNVFMLMDGTKIQPTGVVLYQQNIPFSATFASDNVGTFAESPLTCNPNTLITFHLQISNSIYSANYGINEIVFDASAFSGISVSNNPSGWSSSISSGVITWTASSNLITRGNSLNFTWSGTSPNVLGYQAAFPFQTYWSGGIITSQADAEGCYV